MELDTGQTTHSCCQYLIVGSINYWSHISLCLLYCTTTIATIGGLSSSTVSLTTSTIGIIAGSVALVIVLLVALVLTVICIAKYRGDKKKRYNTVVNILDCIYTIDVL